MALKEEKVSVTSGKKKAGIRMENVRTLHTSWTVQEVIAAEARLLESFHYEVETYSPAYSAHLLATRFSLKADQLRLRTPPAMRSPLLLTVVPVEVVRSGALFVAAGFARDCRTLHRAALGSPRGSSRVCFGCVFFMLESGGVDSALARVTLLDTDFLPPSLSLMTVLLLIFHLLSSVCILVIGRVSNTCSN